MALADVTEPSLVQLSAPKVGYFRKFGRSVPNVSGTLSILAFLRVQSCAGFLPLPGALKTRSSPWNVIQENVRPDQ